MAQRHRPVLLGLSLGGFLLAAVAGGQQFLQPDVRVLHTFTGEAAGDQFGWVTAKLGDLDGDGVDDLVITAPYNDAGGNDAGRIYVYSAVKGKLLFRTSGPVAGGQFGYSVGATGDLTGDDVPDILVGAPAAGAGRAYVVSGSDGTVADFVSGENGGDGFGQAVRSLGDLDGDGVDDILVGAAGFDGTGSNAGRVYVYSGADLEVLDTLDGSSPGDQFGSGLGALGDVDLDGLPDFGVGAPNGGNDSKGRAYVYSGAGSALLCELFPETTGVALGEYFISSVGDLDGDGRPEIYVTDWQDRAAGTQTGRGYVYSFDGSSCNQLYLFTGGRPGDGLGIGNGQAGQVDGDGVPDLLIVSWSSSDGSPGAGKVDVYSGADGSLFRTITSTTRNEGFGFDGHTMNDVDGDHFPDFLISAANNSAAGNIAGRAYLVAGNSPFACTDIRRMKLRCNKNGVITANVSTKLPGGTYLRIEKDGEVEAAKTAPNGRAKVKFRHQTGVHTVSLLECPDVTARVNCGP